MVSACCSWCRSATSWKTTKLVLTLLVLMSALALVGAALSTTPTLFLTASLSIGLGSVAVQVLVRFAANMAPDASRGRVVGNVARRAALRHHARPSRRELPGRGHLLARRLVRVPAVVMVDACRDPACPAAGPHAAHPAELARSWPRWRISPCARASCSAARSIRPACSAPSGLFWTTTPLLLAGPPSA